MKKLPIFDLCQIFRQSVLIAAVVFPILGSQEQAFAINVTPFPWQYQEILERSIKTAISAIKSSKGFEQASTGHVDLHKIFNQLRDDKILQANTSLCVILNSLNTPDLILLDEEIREEENAPLLKDCLSNLDKQIDKYWEAQVAELPNHDGLFQATGDEDKVLTVIEHPVDMSHAGPYSAWKTYKDKQITLTFDDGPHSTRTEVILDALAKYQARVIFFNLGNNASARPDLVRKIIAAGHTLGSHTYSHPDLAKLPFETAKDQIIRGHINVFEAAGGLIDPFFRFPYGSDSDLLKKFLADSQIESFRWNMDSLDWKTPDVHQLIDQVEKLFTENKKGVILMHDIQKQTSLALPYILDFLYQNDYTLVIPMVAANDEHLVFQDVPILRDQSNRDEIFVQAGRAKSSMSYPLK